MKSVISIAGSDSSGGAGIQADIKTIAAHDLFAQTALTALTAQNTTGVFGVLDVDPDFVRQQIRVVFDDIRPDAVKIGMISSASIAHAIADALEEVGADNIVVDPVMVATSGSALIDERALEALVGRLFPLAHVITPNIPEAVKLAGCSITCEQEMEDAADCLVRLLSEGAYVLVKGGHLTTDASDLLASATTRTWLREKRVDTANTHGTGCTLSSAIACGLACGMDVPEAASAAKDYVTGALASGLDLGHGSGPLDHMWNRR
ncbi:MAG: bifunctional hydroxymethylpyrimidine kinase/phosphomethylpyrimidine kinase [Eggerthellaceae bacterium]|nr:bifunctional hydroxymethylpyrimidine kinase/phosphomethylpyrimidine kinase [Eggerthellaceae bacterium]